MIHKKRGLRRALLGTASLGLCLSATSAYAQDGTEDIQGEEVEEVTITGTRIKRSSLSAPVPVTALGAEDIKLSGSTDVASIVQEVPALLSSVTASQGVDDQAIEGSGANAPNPGVAVLNLRALGTNRTLTLVDGRRHVGGRADDTAVDVGTIPAALIERVEVLTGGASAIYGADAVSGVVNFIMRDDFEGIEANAQITGGDGLDGMQYYGALTMGSNFADDRGNVAFSVEYRNQRILRCGETPFCRDFGIEDDQSNPALRFQAGETIPDGFQVGDLKPADLVPAGTPSRIFLPHSTFAISSPFGRIGIDFDGDGGVDGAAPSAFFIDTDGNGVNDVGQTFLGRNGFGDFVVDGGQLRLFDTGLIASRGNQFGGDGIASSGFNFQTIIPQQETINANTFITYKVADTVDFFVDAKYVYSEIQQFDQVNGFNDLLTVTLENPFIPTELRTALDSAIATDPGLADTTTLFVTRDNIDLGPNLSTNDRETFRIVGGLEGAFDNGILFELSYNYGRTSESFSNTIRIEDRFFAALDVVVDPATGEAVCRSELDPSAPPPPTSPFPFIEPGFRTFSPGDGQCQPLNIFGIGAPSQEAIDFVMTTVNQRQVIEQNVVFGYLSGDSSSLGFQLPAGPISFVAGGEYREEDSSFEPDGLEENGLVFDGNPIAGLTGGYDVWEAFAEISAPLLVGKPFAEELTLNAAVRYSDYSTVGTTWTWQVGGTWTPIQDIRLRGGYSVAVRAPNISELFQTPTAAFFRPIDPCEAIEIPNAPDPSVRAANCAADGIPADFTDPLTGRFAGTQSGNLGLNEEEATTWTIGAVIQPRFAPGLSITIDYFNIEIEDAIEFVGSQDIVNNCYDDPNGINNAFCDLIGRNRDSSSTTFLGLNFLQQSSVNIGGVEVAGIDFDINYTLGLKDLGSLDFRIFGTWYDKLNETPNQLDPTFINPELEEIRRPEWSGNAQVRWRYERLTVGYDLRYIGDQLKDDVEFELLDGFVNPWAGDIFIHDISFNYDMNETVSFYGGINNIADRDPVSTSSTYPTNPLGRTLFLGINTRF
ncbi:TonB-dependent receptor-like protein [Eilatimonas milleporae]|uniref:TonB-dependent receptor-like protein n=2 Tax=Eilatimonas milleporae TaxID=911205 RepID=A0A3M0BVX1_9PROT|nr:TonB-dependent receptor-like protein [Eilatimonas milleporae]